MSKENDSVLIFQERPEITIATNTFVNVPIILQYDDVPLIEVVKTVDVGFDIVIPIYHSDGTHLATVRGSRIIPTPDGKKAGIILRHPDRMEVCEIGGRTVFEITRVAAAGLKMQAELYAPDASFLKCLESEIAGFVLDGNQNQLKVGGATIQGLTVNGHNIGIKITKNGSVSIGTSG